MLVGSGSVESRIARINAGIVCSRSLKFVTRDDKVNVINASGLSTWSFYGHVGHDSVFLSKEASAMTNSMLTYITLLSTLRKGIWKQHMA